MGVLLLRGWVGPMVRWVGESTACAAGACSCTVEEVEEAGAKGQAGDASVNGPHNGHLRHTARTSLGYPVTHGVGLQSNLLCCPMYADEGP